MIPLIDSVLFREPGDRAPDEQIPEPDFFVDLNLDQIVTAITAGKEEYNLVPFFRMPLCHADAVAFRHEIFQDLEDARLLDAIKAFAESMRSVRKQFAETGKRYYEHQNERMFLDAVDVYGAAVIRLVGEMSARPLRSRGLRAFKEYISQYAASDCFDALVRQAGELRSELAAVRYGVLVQGSRVEVRRYESQIDYSAEVKATFERFSQGEANEYPFHFSESLTMNHVEGMILDLAAQLFNDTFARLKTYCAEHRDFQDRALLSFDREIQFYVAFLDYTARLNRAGLGFCYPLVSQTGKEVHACQCFDLALAGKLIDGSTAVVTNDFYLKGTERIIVVSGPNQGGKTTFARTFGQLHYLASLGCPVPGADAQLYLSDRIFTHFERQEQMVDLRGKLQDDLVRIHEILEASTPHSVIIINEIFTSTTLRDASFLSKKIAAAIMELDVLCIWVTFIDEVASLGQETVSMVSTVAPDNPTLRTFKVVRRPADGLAFAVSIAEKYRLSYEMTRKRIGS